MATLGDILKQNKIPLKSSVEPHYHRFSDAYLSLAGDPAYSDLVAFERACERTIKFKDGTWNVTKLDVFIKSTNTYDSFKANFANIIRLLNEKNNNIYTDELLSAIWTQILTLKQQVH